MVSLLAICAWGIGALLTVSPRDVQGLPDQGPMRVVRFLPVFQSVGSGEVVRTEWRGGRIATLTRSASATSGADRPKEPPPSAQDEDSLVRARRFMTWFFTGAVDSIWAHLTPPGQQAYPTPDALHAVVDKIASWGREVGPVSEGFDRVNGRTRYHRTTHFEHRGSPMTAALEFDTEWHLVGWRFGESS